MGVGILLAVAAAGCGGGSGGGGRRDAGGADAIACESDDVCPPGQTCIDGRCQTMGDPDGPAGTPDIIVTPVSLDFGSALFGIETCLAVEVANAGDAPLEISTITVDEDDDESEFFASPGGEVAWVIDEGSRRFDVCFVARDDLDDTGRAIIASNDPDEAEVEVELVSDLKGEPLASWCVLAPDWEPLACPPPFEESASCTNDDAIDYDAVPYGETAVAELALWNGGTENRPLRIDDVYVSDDVGAADQFAVEVFRLDDAGEEAPVDLAEGPAYLTACTDVLYLRVSFTPDAGGWVPAEELRIDWVDEDDDPQETAIPFAGRIEGCPPGFVDANGDPDDGCEYACAKAGVEACDGIDNDCDGEIDEGYDLGTPCDGADADDCAEGVTVCTADGTGAECDDTTGDTVEFCDGVDNDCDGAVDEGFGVGSPCDGGDGDLCAEGSVTCDATGTGTECTDTTGTNVEACNGADDDCDGEIDEGTNACGGACVLSPAVGSACDFVGAGDLDTCADDAYTCSGLNSTICTNVDTDLDNDGWSSGAGGCGDCDDTDAARYPGAPETCNGIDDDCDGTVDGGTNACGGACPLTNPPGTACDSSAPSDLDTCTDDTYTCSGPNATICSDVDTDVDNDNYSPGGVACGGDCDDSNAARNPGAAETCNSLDDDCDGTVDEGTNACGGACVLSPAVGTACDFAGASDLDTCTDDSYTCAGLNSTACTDIDTDLDNDNYSPGAAACGGDCDDGNAARYPGAAELCDSIDNDCDSVVDEGSNACGGACPITAPCSGCCDSTSGTDLDDCLDDSIICVTINSTSCTDIDTDIDNDNWSLDGATCTGDCNDGNAAVNPGVAEVCGNGIDDNCDGGTDTGDAACVCAAGECGGSGGSCSCAGACLIGGDCCENACSVCGGTAGFLGGGTDITGGTATPASGDTSTNPLAMNVPVCAGPAVARTDWYRFTISTAQMIALDTFTSSFDTVLSLHAGNCGAAFSFCDDDSCATTQSGMAKHLAAGTYFVSVKPKSGSGGSYSLMYEPSGCGQPTAGTMGTDLFELKPPVSAVASSTSSSTTGKPDNWFMGGAAGCQDGAEDVMYFFHGCPGKAMEFGVCSAGYDTVLGIFEGDTTCTGAGLCNNNSCGIGGLRSFLNTTGALTANRGLWFTIVDGYLGTGADGAYTMTYRFIP